MMLPFPQSMTYPFPEVTVPWMFVHIKNQDLEVLRLHTLVLNQGMLIKAYEDRHGSDQETISLLNELKNIQTDMIKKLEDSNNQNYDAATDLFVTLYNILDHQNQGGE